MRPSAIEFLLLLFFVQETALAAEKPADLIPHMDETRTIVLEANLLRTSKGLPPLRIDPGLCRAADFHAQEMAQLNYFSHRGPQSMFASTPGSRAFRQGYELGAYCGKYLCRLLQRERRIQQFFI
jgi:uncharacterized protein YkwD